MPVALLGEFGVNVLLILTAVAAYGLLLGWVPSQRLLRAMLTGLLFGVMAALAMAMPVRLSPVAEIDFGGLLVAAGAAIGGPLAGGLSALLAGSGRLFLGAADPAWALLGIGLAAIGGLAVHRLSARLSPPRRNLQFLALGVYEAARQTFVLLLSPSGEAAAPGVLLPYWLAAPAAVWLLGTLLTDARELHRKRLLLEATLDTMSQGLLVFDKELRLRAHNPRAMALLGMPGHLFRVGTHARDGLLFNARAGEYGPGDPERIADERLRGMATSAFARLERVRRDGTVLEMTHMPMPDGGFLSTYTDVTAWRRAEAAARLSEQRLRGFADVASDWFWEMDASLRFTWFSEKFETVVGVPAEQFIGKTREEIGEAETDTGLWAEHQAVLANRRPFRDFEYRAYGPKGIHWLRVSGDPIFGEDGRFLGYRGCCRDVTAEVAARRAASEVKERFLHATASMSDGISFWDVEGRFVLCNAVYRELMGISDAEPGLPAEVQLRRGMRSPPDGAAAGPEPEPEAVPGASATGSSSEIRRNGRWLLLRESRSPDAGTVVILTDISPLKEREGQLRRAREAAEHASLVKSRFLANMSHELRTPLNAIIGFSEVIEQAVFGPVSAQYQEYAADIRRSGCHLLELINTLLDLAKIEAGKMKPADEAVELVSLAGDLRKLVLAGHDRPAAPVTVAAAGATELRADGRMVKQMLLNLLSNAVKFTPADGRVTVTVEPADNGGVHLSVADSGAGMGEDDLTRVLQPFEQADTPLVRQIQGSGLGLPLTKALIELHGGSLSLQSAPGQGTTAILTFPPERVARAAIAAPGG